MLNEHDEPTIKHAIYRRLDKEAGVTHTAVMIKRYDDYLAVTVEADAGLFLHVESRFDLPIPFEHGHLLNEVDEVAESFKKARLQYLMDGCPKMMPEQSIKGTGLRGQWKRYGLLRP